MRNVLVRNRPIPWVCRAGALPKAPCCLVSGPILDPGASEGGSIRYQGSDVVMKFLFAAALLPIGVTTPPALPFAVVYASAKRSGAR